MKTFKIGEYCIGGIVKAELKNNVYRIQIVDWYTKGVIKDKQFNNRSAALHFLEDMSTHYWADKIISKL